jgi:uncharacterized protein GlcG (DUF336 family)
MVGEKAGERIDDDTANALLEAAKRRAKELELPVSIAIVDAAGQLLRFERQQGSILISLTMAQDKAFTAASFGVPTHEWTDIIKDDPQLTYGIPNYPRLVVIGGGFPIRIGGHLVGGIGVSGGHYRDDMDVAQAALAAIDAPASRA